MCYSLWYNAPTMLPVAGSLEAVELIGIINKPLLLHLVSVYIIYINDARSDKYQSQFNLLNPTRYVMHQQV